MVAVEHDRVSSPYGPETLVRRWLMTGEIRCLAVTDEIAIRARTLRFLQADPFDRIIAATAVCERAPLMTADERLMGVDWLAVVPAQQAVGRRRLRSLLAATKLLQFSASDSKPKKFYGRFAASIMRMKSWLWSSIFVRLEMPLVQDRRMPNSSRFTGKSGSARPWARRV